MTLTEIVEKCSGLEIYEKRCVTDECVDIVFCNNEIDKWNEVLSEIFGPATKPAGTKPTKEDQRVSAEYGGIYGEQTLYRKELNGAFLIAMFWPWQSASYTTLKMFVCKQ